jgi:exoribonuclease-2
VQENVKAVDATVLRENLCRFDELPLVVRVNSAPGLRSGTPIVLEVSDVDLIELALHCEFRHERVRADVAARAEEGTASLVDADVPVSP